MSIRRHALALLALCAPALAQPGPPQQSLARRIPDPSVETVWPCYYWGYYKWNDGTPGVGTVQGRLYWPSDCVSPRPPALHPLVVLVHGDGHAFTDYHYLCRHLALNGFIVATIDGGSEKTNVERAERVRTYLDFVRNHWVYAANVENSIALVGHSRGGEGVLTAARKIVEWGLDHDVNAVVSIAPTDSDDNGGAEGLESLVRSSAEAYMVIYGSRDEDVSGYCVSGTFLDCGLPPAQPMGTGFSLYDRAGSEGSTDDLPWFDDVVQKCMLFVDGATHNRFREVNCGGFDPPWMLSCEAHKNLAKGYVTAFLRWQLMGEELYRHFCTGRWKPKTVADDGALIRTQYSNGSGRRVVDDFEQPGWSVSSIGGVQKDQVTVLHEGPTFDYGNYTIPHDTSALVLSWDRPNKFVIAPWMRWSVPDLITPNLGKRLRDVREFGYLSLRAGQIWESLLNTQGEDQRFYVQLADAWGNWSPKVPVSKYARLAFPDQGSIINLLGSGDFPKSGMITVRVPLTAFPGVDLENVSEVELEFGDPERLEGEIVIDSIEFTD